MTRILLTSTTRIAPFHSDEMAGTVLPGDGLSTETIARDQWRNGDYVVGRVREGSPLRIPFELCSGRMVEVGEGDLVMGALGRRAATLEAVGSFEDIGDDGVFDALTGAGLFGRVTSQSDLIPPLTTLDYEGHVSWQGRRLAMEDCVAPTDAGLFALPVVLIVGSSMSAGKTTTGRAIVRALRRAGQRVVAAKLTGAARYRDVLSLGDAGAEWTFDFVDAGLPSTVCPQEEFRQRISSLLGEIAATPADVAVFEAGASPLEPYNGATVVELLDPHIRCTVLCASDPYAVLGILDAFKRRPDLVAGPAANTDAGISLVKKLTGVDALDARSPSARPRLEELLERTLTG